MNVLVFTTLWPNAEEPNFGVFIKHRALALSQLDGVKLRVVAPVPYFPKSLAGALLPKSWQVKARIKEQEVIEGVTVEHPRYLVTPKVGMRFYGDWMARGAEAVVRELHRQEPFDLIDAHYIYPDAYAALQLGRSLDLPVVMTARGSDINQFTQLPYIRPLIQRALGEADGIIAVSEGLKREMIALGIAADKIKVIRNGINRDIFHLKDQASARRLPGLDAQRRIIITVSRLIQGKGLDRLIQAMAVLARRSLAADALLYIIGAGPERAALEKMIAAYGLQNRVFLTGARLQSELPDWYAAADLFCLATHREGCPNVVIEALACGLPVIATDTPGVDELITDSVNGLLVPVTNSPAESFADKIAVALGKEWHRRAIASSGGARDWQEVAQEVKDTLSAVIARHHQQPAKKVCPDHQ